MTACERMREQIQAYCDGVLPESDRRSVEVHLSNCRGCAALLSGYQQVFDLLSRPAIPAVPRRLTAAVLARVSAARRRRRLLQTGVLAAALLAGVGVALLAGWGAVDAAPLQAFAEWNLDEVWRSTTGAIADLAEQGAAVGAESAALSLPVFGLLALLALAADALLLWRWRGLATVERGETRATR